MIWILGRLRNIDYFLIYLRESECPDDNCD